MTPEEERVERELERRHRLYENEKTPRPAKVEANHFERNIPMNANGTPKLLHGYLINPEDRTVKRASFPNDENTLDSFYRLIKCETVDAVTVAEDSLGRRETLWVDDEGLFKPKHDRYHFTVTKFDGAGVVMQTLCGRALMLSTDVEGRTESTRMGERELCRRIIFHDIMNVAGSPRNMNAAFAAGVAGVIELQAAEFAEG